MEKQKFIIITADDKSVEVESVSVNAALSAFKKTNKVSVVGIISTEMFNNFIEIKQRNTDRSKERFFTVFYSGYQVHGYEEQGSISISVPDGKYLNYKQTIASISSVTKNLSRIIIKNVIEVSREDSKNWNL